jgi:hypothetical protein
VRAVVGRLRFGFEGVDAEDAVDFLDFLRCQGILADDFDGEVDGSDEFAEHLDNQEW